MPILKASDYIVSDETMKFFITGDFGTGKSEFAASFPTPGFVFNFDHKIATYARWPGWDYSEWDISASGWVQYEKDEREVIKACNEGMKYKTIVYDSTTAMTDMAMARAMQLDSKRSASDGPIWNVHYQIVRNLMEGHLRTALNFKANLVVIAHLNIQMDDTGAIIGIEPLLTGQLSVRVPGYFEEVYCAFTRTKDGKPEWYLRTVPRGYYKARSTLSGRTSLLPYELPNSYSAVMKAYKYAVEEQARKIAEIKVLKSKEILQQ